MAAAELMSVDVLPELASIPAGEFVMGSEDADPDERPIHRIFVDEFQIGVHPVTQAEYAAFVQATGYRSPAIYELPLVVTAGGPDRERAFRQSGQPYVWLNSEPPPEAGSSTPSRSSDSRMPSRIVEWLSRVSGRTVRLPTEAEWEKAARGGLESKRYPWGDRLDRDMANYLVDPSQRHASGTTQCRTYPANGYGLFDAAGNAWQWVQDWYDARLLCVLAAPQPVGAEPRARSGCVRGGSWLVADGRMLSCSHRHNVPPDTYSYGIGFRIVVEKGWRRWSRGADAHVGSDTGVTAGSRISASMSDSCVGSRSSGARGSRISTWSGSAASGSSRVALTPRSRKRRAVTKHAGLERSDELVVGRRRLLQVDAQVLHVVRHHRQPLVQLGAERPDLLGVLREALLLPGGRHRPQQREQRQRRRRNDALVRRVVEQRRRRAGARC